MKLFYFFLSVVLFMVACEHNTHEHISSTPIPQYEQNTIKPASIIKINIEDSSKSKITFLNKIDINTPHQLAGEPTVTIAKVPKICTPGQNGFKLPKKIKAIHHPKLAKEPTIIPSKSPDYKDFTSQCFSIYSRKQGMPHNSIFDLTEDKNGCLWIGTVKAGAVKYDGKNYYQFNKKSGINDKAIIALIQDKKRNMWFCGEENGIAKYDGKYFTNYTTKEGLCFNYTMAILEDRKGNLWIGTQNGLSKFDGKYFTNYTTNEGLSDNFIKSITEDTKGNLWFGTNSKGIMKYDGKSFSHYSTEQGLSGSDIWDITEDRSGNLWLASYFTGVFKFDHKSFSNYTTYQGLSSNNIMSIKIDQNNNLWLASFDNGITKYDGKNFTHYSIKEGLGSNIVFCLYIDKKNNVWAGTFHGGINKYNGNKFNHLSENDGLLNDDISSLYRDHDNRIWISSSLGLSIYDEKSITNYKINNSPNTNIVFGFTQNSKNELWMSTMSEGIFRLKDETLTQLRIKQERNSLTSKMIVDKNDNLWFATTGSGIFVIDDKTITNYTEKSGLFSNYIIGLVVDKNGTKWLGSDKGLLKWEGNKVTRYTTKNGLITNDIRCVCVDRNNNIWIGSEFGLVIFDHKKMFRYTEKNGLVHNYINSIIENKKGNIIITTYNGISEVKSKNINKLLSNDKSNKNHPVFTNYTYEDGLIGIGSITIDIAEDKYGSVYFPSNDKLTIYNQKEEISKSKSFPFKVEISKIRLYNEDITWSYLDLNKSKSFKLKNGIEISDYQFDSISQWSGIPVNLSLSHNNNNITFDFIGIELNSPGKVKYKYILEGNDKKWSSLTSENDVNYGNLAPGQYTLKVKAINNEGVWSPVEKYTFTIRPPWWGTWWFRISAFIFMVFLVVYYVFYRESKLKKKFRDEIDFLKNQINPHFLFNSLNNIMVMHRMQHKETENSIGNLSELLKYQLYDCSYEKVPLNKEIEHIENFMNLEKLRFFNLETKFTIIENDNRYNKLIEPLLLTMFIENAFKHSRKNSEKHYVHVQLTINKDSILFSVENSKSKDYKPSEIGGIGIKNVIRRLDLVYGKKYDLSISDNEESYRIDLNIKK